MTLPEGRWLFRALTAALAAALTAALTAALMAPRPAVAHEPTSTAARVTVRSGHVELRLMLDLLPLLAEVAEPAPTQPATTQPATTQPATTQPVIAEPSLSSDAHNPPLPMTLLPLVDPPAFERRIARARRAIPDGTTLTADGRRVALALTRFPTTAELTTAARTALMAQAIEGHAHGPRVEVLLEGRLTGRPQTLTLTLPPAMGPAVVTWIEPTTQVLPVGSTARHRLRADR